MISRNGIRAILAGLLVLALVPASAHAAPAVNGEFPVASQIEANNKIVEGPDGNMWLTMSGLENDVARITPSGEVKEFKLEVGLKKVESATGIARGPEGNLWITGKTGAEGLVAKFSPSDPAGTTVLTDIAQVKSPASIVTGPDGMMWVATEGVVVRFPPSAADPNASKQLFPIGGLTPKDIDAAGSLLAIANSGLEPKIVTLNTAGEDVKDYAIAGGSQGVAGNAGGLIAYSQQEKQPEQVGLISPPNLLPPVDLPGGVGDPFGVALGSDQAFWVVLFASEGVERLTTTGAASFLPGLRHESMPRQIASGPGNTLWVTQTQNENAGVARVTGLEPPNPPPPPPPKKAPQTTLGKGPKGTVKTTGKLAKVSLKFSSPDAGASFECRLNTLGGKKAKGSKAAKFRACRSPKTYRLKPGRYRFEARAVLAGVADRSPAKRSFKVVHVAAKRHR